MSKLTDEQKNELRTRAIVAARSAYAPYSKFRVGAAVLTAEGIYTGVNVENASYGLTLCAERNALSTAVTEGQRDIRAIAIACIDARSDLDINGRMPCGACRQWIQELAPNAIVLIAGEDREFSAADLLPTPFKIS